MPMTKEQLWEENKLLRRLIIEKDKCIRERYEARVLELELEEVTKERDFYKGLYDDYRDKVDSD